MTATWGRAARQWRAGAMPQGRRSVRAWGTAILVAFGFSLSACGTGAASPTVASVRSSPTTTASGGSRSDGSSNTVDSRSTTTTVSATAGSSPVSVSFTTKALKFAQCMRSHGVSDYPDPRPAGNRPPAPTNGMTYLGDSFNPNTPAFQTAERGCQKDAVGLATPVTANGAAKVEAEQLRYAQCMRTHGVPDFPDPSANGAFTLPSSLDQNGSSVQGAERRCRNLLPGIAGPPGR